MTEDEVAVEMVVEHPHGLHLRPAAQFVRLAASLGAQAWVTNLSRDPDRRASGRSLLQVTGLAVDQGDRIRISATGEGAAASVERLRALIESGFSEG